MGGFCPTDFTDIHRSFFIMIFLHQISRMNRRHSCLSDYSRIFAELWPLANGWRPIYTPVVFCHADFADDADFSLCEGFVPQISQIYTDSGLVRSLEKSTQISQMTQFFLFEYLGDSPPVYGKNESV